MTDQDWEPAELPPRGTRWARGEDGSWVPLAPGEPEGPNDAHAAAARGAPEQADESARRGVSVVTIAVMLGTVVLAIAWWGLLGVDVPFLYLTPSPMLDFILLTVASVAWCWFLWRWLSRPR